MVSVIPAWIRDRIEKLRVGNRDRVDKDVLRDLGIEFGFKTRLPIILQGEAAECGLACLTMIAHALDGPLDLSDLRRDYPISLQGMTLTHLTAIAGELGFGTRALRLDLEEMESLILPCILHWELDHFVVLKAIRSHAFEIHDPAIGFRRLSTDEFSRCFTGIALEVWLSGQSAKIKRAIPESLPLTQIIGKVTGAVPTFLHVFSLALAIEILALVSPLLTQWVIDYVIVSDDRDLLTTCVVGFGLLFLLQQAITAMRGWVVMYVGTSWSLQWKSNILAHLLRLSPEFFQRRHLGDIVSRFDAVDQIQGTITTSFVTAVLDGLMASATLIMMIIYSPMMAMIAIGTIVLYALLRVVTFRPLRGITQQRIVLAAKVQTFFLETIRGIRPLKLFSKEERRRLGWLSLYSRQINVSLKTQRAQLIFQTASSLLTGLERICILWLGARLIMDGQFTVGILMAFVSYNDQFDTRISSLIDKYFELKMLRLQTARLGEIVQSSPEELVGHQSIRSWSDRVPTIDIKQLRFSYSKQPPFILDGVTFSIGAEESVAIAGRSGSGKTTLVNIIMGLTPATFGTITFDGIALEHLGTQQLRKLIGAVSQDDQLFAGSIAENISFFDHSIDQGWLEECSRLAAVHDEIVAMPMGYRSLVGDMGAALSGGQKQRILLARALYKRPKILVLDEATSHLDIDLEKSITNTLRELKMTRIAVAHRPQTLAGADRIITLQNGRVAAAQTRAKELSKTE